MKMQAVQRGRQGRATAAAMVAEEEAAVKMQAVQRGRQGRAAAAVIAARQLEEQAVAAEAAAAEAAAIAEAQAQAAEEAERVAAEVAAAAAEAERLAAEEAAEAAQAEKLAAEEVAAELAEAAEIAAEEERLAVEAAVAVKEEAERVAAEEAAAEEARLVAEAVAKEEVAAAEAAKVQAEEEAEAKAEAEAETKEAEEADERATVEAASESEPEVEPESSPATDNASLDELSAALEQSATAAGSFDELSDMIGEPLAATEPAQETMPSVQEPPEITEIRDKLAAGKKKLTLKEKRLLREADGAAAASAGPAVEAEPEAMPELAPEAATKQLHLEPKPLPEQKLVLLGDSGVGKTSLLRQFRREEFQFEHAPTVGLENYKVESTIGEVQIKVRLWDKSGESTFGMLSKAYFKAGKGALIVYDVTSRESFDSVGKWVNVVRAEIPECPLVLCGNKTDAPADEVNVTDAEAQEACTKYGILGVVEVSAKTGDNVQAVWEKLAGSAVLADCGADISETATNTLRGAGALTTADVPPPQDRPADVQAALRTEAPVDENDDLVTPRGASEPFVVHGKSGFTPSFHGNESATDDSMLSEISESSSLDPDLSASSLDMSTSTMESSFAPPADNGWRCIWCKCGRSETEQTHAGPDGPESLCDVCGRSYAKQTGGLETDTSGVVPVDDAVDAEVDVLEKPPPAEGSVVSHSEAPEITEIRDKLAAGKKKLTLKEKRLLREADDDDEAAAASAGPAVEAEPEAMPEPAQDEAWKAEQAALGLLSSDEDEGDAETEDDDTLSTLREFAATLRGTTVKLIIGPAELEVVDMNTGTTIETHLHTEVRSWGVDQAGTELELVLLEAALVFECLEATAVCDVLKNRSIELAATTTAAPPEADEAMEAGLESEGPEAKVDDDMAALAAELEKEATDAGTVDEGGEEADAGIVDASEEEVAAEKVHSVYTALKKGVVRAAYAKDSPKIGDLVEGELIEAYEGQMLDGQLRIRFVRGWVSLTSAKGMELLKLTNGKGFLPVFRSDGSSGSESEATQDDEDLEALAKQLDQPEAETGAEAEVEELVISLTEEEETTIMDELVAGALGSIRFCKKCKVVFDGSSCPKGHANFQFTKKLPENEGASAKAAAKASVAGAFSEKKAEALEEKKLKVEQAAALVVAAGAAAAAAPAATADVQSAAAAVAEDPALTALRAKLANGKKLSLKEKRLIREADELQANGGGDSAAPAAAAAAAVDVQAVAAAPAEDAAVTALRAKLASGKKLTLKEKRLLREADASHESGSAAPAATGKTLPFHYVSNAFVAETLPLPCVSTAFAATTPHFVLCFRYFRDYDTAFALCFHCLHGYDTAFALCFACLRS